MIGDISLPQDRHVYHNIMCFKYNIVLIAIFTCTNTEILNWLKNVGSSVYREPLLPP